MLHLAMKVLLLNRALQQILAGDLTRGGLLSFLLYQEDVGNYMHVSRELCVLSFSSFGFYLFPLKKQTEITPTHCHLKFQTWVKKRGKG